MVTHFNITVYVAQEKVCVIIIHKICLVPRGIQILKSSVKQRNINHKCPTRLACFESNF